jgi:hypothetical protein
MIEQSATIGGKVLWPTLYLLPENERHRSVSGFAHLFFDYHVALQRL